MALFSQTMFFVNYQSVRHSSKPDGIQGLERNFILWAMKKPYPNNVCELKLGFLQRLGFYRLNWAVHFSIRNLAILHEIKSHLMIVSTEDFIINANLLSNWHEMFINFPVGT